MPPITRSLVALVLVALQLALAAWGPCPSSMTDGNPAAVAASSTADDATHAHHRAGPPPAPDEGADPAPHESSSCLMMGACGPAGIHEAAVVRADRAPDHLAAISADAAAPAFMPLSPEPPPPRG